MKQSAKPIGPIVFGDANGGLSNTDPPHAIGDNHAYETLNTIFEKIGISRAPGLTGISDSAIFNAPVRGWFKYMLSNGSEYYLAATNYKLYSVDLSDGTLTELYSLSSDNECFGVNYFGKFWIVNGVDAIKVENDLNVYRIGIAAPELFVTSTVSGGSLTNGVYTLYATYSREVDGTVVLHSEPLSLGTVTISLGGDKTIRVTTLASSDPQVNKITIWSSYADGTDIYWIAEGDNVNGSIDIDSVTINEDLLMYEQAASNQLPSSLKTIYAHGSRLLGTVNDSNEVYYSYFCQNVYDCERWPTENYIPSIPFTSLCLFAIDKNLYVNTIGGVYRFLAGDLNSKPEPVIQGAGNNLIFYFPENMIKTIQEYNNIVYGITNDGFRYFDGISFSIDLSQHIKPEIDKVVNGSGTYNPYGIIYRRSAKRTEYQLSFHDNDLSSDCNNRTLVLNISRTIVIDNDNYIAPWELWGHGYSGAIVNSIGQLVVSQHITVSGTVAIETGTALLNCFNEKGVYLSTKTAKRLYYRSNMRITELAGVDTWHRIYFLVNLDEDCTIKVLITESSNYRANVSVGKTVADPPILNAPENPLILPFVLNPNNPINSWDKLPLKTRGNSVALEIEQTADDESFLISRVELYGMHERNIFV